MNAAPSCSICIRGCRLGQSFCGRRDGDGNAALKNRLCALLVDSLFDKPVFHFSKNMKVLSLGSWGCNLRCLGCQNPQLSWTTTGEGLGYVEMAPAEIIRLAQENGCAGISYSYNEPAILIEEVEDIAQEAKEAGLFNFFITNSTLTPLSVKKIAPWLDAVAADIKSLEDDFYYQYCGAQGIEQVAAKILTCVKAFHGAGCHVEVRTNIIPGANDQEGSFLAIAHWIRANLGEESPWHLTRFFPAHKLSHVYPTPTQTLLKAQKIGLGEGLKYVHIYFSKGCDCAKDSAMIEPHRQPGRFSIKSCCDWPLDATPNRLSLTPDKRSTMGAASPLSSSAGKYKRKHGCGV